MLIYDCSNSEERPINRRYGGSVENAVISILKKYGGRFDVYFTENIHQCDLILTNDVFPRITLSIDRPKVKRMDGVFWQNNLKGRNSQYIEACKLADLVIFVSKYSQKSLRLLYPQVKIKTESVVLNWVDEELFYKHNKYITSYPTKFIAVATSWARSEKNLHDLIWFSHNIRSLYGKLYLVGNLPKVNLPTNIIPLGFIQYEFLGRILCEMDGLINFSYRDAAPKTVAESICCDLPVFYANSGGVSELVGEYGVSWTSLTDTPNKFEDSTPSFKSEENYIKDAFFHYIEHYKDIKQKILNQPPQTLQLVRQYVKLFEGVLK